jgi:predicted DNA-binding protein (UPF0251 family)
MMLRLYANAPSYYVARAGVFYPDTISHNQRNRVVTHMKELGDLRLGQVRGIPQTTNFIRLAVAQDDARLGVV